MSVIALAILLVLCLYGTYATRNGQKASAPDQPLLDTGLMQTALRLSPLAATADEQTQAREAWRLADHELDVTFATTLRQAEAEAALPKKGPLRELSERIERLKVRVEAGKKHVKELESGDPDEVELARAHLDLDQNELDDAQEDLARESGDKRGKLQRLLQEHEASEKVVDQSPKFGTLASTATAIDQVRESFALRDYDQQLQAAAEQANAHAKGLLERHDAAERDIPKQAEDSASAGRLRELAEKRKKLTDLDVRVQDTKQLAGVYGNWSKLVKVRQWAVTHALLWSAALILAILLSGWLLNELIVRAFRKSDRRRLHQLRLITRTTLQVIVVLLILLVIFGPPTQVSTMIGLVTAGLTVVMKDFIVAFFGWFTLMGKNGISVGDWVEIEGVSGEVIEIGLLKTVLLELGNWTETGHPTGRRVAFSNSFAMERHYFNFSTAGQWLWDELHCALPGSDDPYQTRWRSGFAKSWSAKLTKTPRKRRRTGSGSRAITSRVSFLRHPLSAFGLFRTDWKWWSVTSPGLRAETW